MISVHDGHSHLQHLDERDCQIQVHDIAKVKGKRHEQANRDDAGHVEMKRDGLLSVHPLEDLHPRFQVISLVSSAEQKVAVLVAAPPCMTDISDKQQV